jgi:hypothetical protein
MIQAEQRIANADHGVLLLGLAAQRTSQLVVRQALVGGIPRVQCLLFKQQPKLLRSPPLSPYRFLVNWELILSPDPKGKIILLR